MMRGSFVPSPVIHELRVYTRKYGKLKAAGDAGFDGYKQYYDKMWDSVKQLSEQCHFQEFPEHR